MLNIEDQERGWKKRSRKRNRWKNIAEGNNGDRSTIERDISSEEV